VKQGGGRKKFYGDSLITLNWGKRTQKIEMSQDLLGGEKKGVEEVGKSKGSCRRNEPQEVMVKPKTGVQLSWETRWVLGGETLRTGDPCLDGRKTKKKQDHIGKKGSKGED